MSKSERMIDALIGAGIALSLVVAGLGVHAIVTAAQQCAYAPMVLN